MGSALEEALVEFFKQTSVSSTIIRRLALAGEPMPHAQLVEAVNNIMAHLLPDYSFGGSVSGVEESLHSFEPTVETGLKLLIGAGIVVEKDSMLSLSDVGNELHDRIGQ